MCLTDCHNYLLHRYVSLAVQLNQIAGPEYLLRVPRILPPPHRSWHYSINGFIMAVQSMYSQGLASPYDINLKNGPAIFYAVKRETPEFAHFLLDQGVDFGLSNNAGVTASELLWDRAFGGRYGAEKSVVVRRLLQGDDYVDNMGFTTLHKIVLGFVYKDFEPYLRRLQIWSTQLTLGAGPHSIGLFSAMTRPLCKIYWITARTRILLTARDSSLLILLEVPQSADPC